MTSADDPRDDDVRDEPRADDTRDTLPNEPVRPAKRRGFLRRHWLGVLVALLILVPLGGFFLWTTATLSYVYSSGDRAGLNQKLSRRGWICKTWEGELMMSAVPGSAPETFRYSVRDDSVAKAIEALAGERVNLHYEQHKGVPTSCFGDTEYFVTSVRKL